VTRAISSAAGIGVSDAARRVLVEVSLLDRQPPFRLSGRNQPSCPTAAARGSDRERRTWVVSGPSPRRIKVAGLRRMEAIR